MCAFHLGALCFSISLFICCCFMRSSQFHVHRISVMALLFSMVRLAIVLLIFYIFIGSTQFIKITNWPNKTKSHLLHMKIVSFVCISSDCVDRNWFPFWLCNVDFPKFNLNFKMLHILVNCMQTSIQ